MKVENFSTTSCAEAMPTGITIATAVAAWTAHRIIAIEVSIAVLGFRAGIRGGPARDSPEITTEPRRHRWQLRAPAAIRCAN
jgi:hypothetical protein